MSARFSATRGSAGVASGSGGRFLASSYRCFSSCACWAAIGSIIASCSLIAARIWVSGLLHLLAHVARNALHRSSIPARPFRMSARSSSAICFAVRGGFSSSGSESWYFFL